MAQAADSVFEKVWFDTGLDDPSAPSNLEDSRAFDAGLSYASRGQCSQVGDLESTPPNSSLDTTFFQAAGREIITANYYNQLSHKRQIMNQADVFYYSGHGSHSSGSLFAGGPADVSGYWDRDLNVVVIAAGCAVLDINEYNDNYTDPIEHTRSPGTAWEPIGPGVLLGYNYTAPLDTQNSDSIIVSWLNDRETLGDIDAWKNANNNSNGRNACAIQKDVSYFYFNKILPLIYVWTEVQKGNW
ncbi:MAG: hypothetical protein GX548_08225 [Lentisphaerae bacterium]|nr:hypothetical protein [Lentisphaerota bacterium]